MRLLMLYSGMSIGVEQYTKQLIDTNRSTEYVKCHTGNETRMNQYRSDDVVDMYLGRVPDDIDGVHIQYDTCMFKGDGDEWDQLENFVKFIQALELKTRVYVTLHGMMFRDQRKFKLNRHTILYRCLRSYWLKTVIPTLNKHTVIVHSQDHAIQLVEQGLNPPVIQLPSLPGFPYKSISYNTSDKFKIFKSKFKVIVNPGRHTERECIHTACDVVRHLKDDPRYELYMNVSIPVEAIGEDLDGHIKYIDFNSDCYSTYMDQLKQFDVAVITYRQDQAAPFSGVIWDCIGTGLITVSTNACYGYMCPVGGPREIARQLNRLTTCNTTREYYINNKYNHVYEHTWDYVDRAYVRIYNKMDIVNTGRDGDNKFVKRDMQDMMTSTQFGQLFCRFLNMMGISRDIYSEDRLASFCNLANIKIKHRYKSLCQDLNLMHSFVCYLRTEQLIECTKSINPPIESDSAVIIPEDRILPHLEFHIRNAMLLLPGYTIKIVCSGSSIEQMSVFCQQIHNNIQVISTGVEKFTQNTYNDMMLSVDFWEQFDEEYILVYQQDAILFRQGVDEFKQYDYVGAPWPAGNEDNRLGVGNGGLSLRKRVKMIECLNTLPPGDLTLAESTKAYMDNKGLWNPPEDVYYSKTMIDNNIGKVPTREVANQFSQEHVISENPVGGHQYWLADEHVNAKTLITYVHYKRSDDSIYEENLNFFLKLGLIDSPDYHFNIIINSDTGGESIPEKDNISVIKGHNKGYDFGAYKQSLDSVNLEDFNRYIFINDTCRGPFIPNYISKSTNWVEMFLGEINSNVKLVGPTWFNAEYDEHLQEVVQLPRGCNTHIQSWCFGTDKNTIKDLIKNKIFDCHGKSHQDVIFHHEIRMSQFLINQGYEVKPFQLSRETEKHSDINHNDAYFETTINPLETMFFKTKASGTKTINNPIVVDNYTKWRLNSIPSEHKIAIVLHVYYVDLWDYFKEKLERLNVDFDLYVTLCEENTDITNIILESFPEAEILKYPNIGQDIGPFIQVFKSIRNKDYDFLIKMHTKKSTYNTDLGNAWRGELVDCLIETDTNINNLANLLQFSNFKMCGAKKWHKVEKWKDGKYYEFIGGTMFMVDFNAFKEILTDEMIDDWYNRMPAGYKQNHSFAHEVERLLGQIVVDAGFKIKGV